MYWIKHIGRLYMSIGIITSITSFGIDLQKRVNNRNRMWPDVEKETIAEIIIYSLDNNIINGIFWPIFLKSKIL